MNKTLQQLADQALVSTQWSVVTNLSTEVVTRDNEIEKFAELLLADCFKVCDTTVDEHNKRFLPIIQTFVKSFKESVKERYNYDKL
jgi:hypothetical protein